MNGKIEIVWKKSPGTELCSEKKDQSWNILWKKSPDSDLYIDYFTILGHKFDCDEYPSWPKENYMKNDTSARNTRQRGEKFFAEKDYLKAMNCFNKALAYAENRSNEVGLAYANRSACFSDLNMFDKCLVDIENAKKANYPSHLMHELDARESKCMELMKDGKYKPVHFSIVDEPKLDFNEHEEHAGVANCLEIRKNAEFGHHVVTTCDLKIGQTILIEQPYSIDYCFRSNRYSDIQYCSYCLKQGMNFITCENCSNEFFCNNNCLVKSFHEVECSLPKKTFVYESSVLVLQAFYNANAAFPDVDEFMYIIEVVLSGEVPNGLTDEQKKFCSIFALVHNHEKISYMEVQYMVRGSKEIFNRLMLIPDIKSKYGTLEKHQRFLKHVILHLLHICSHAFALNKIKMKELDKESTLKSYSYEQFAMAMYQFGCYINHSCVPNVYCFSVDDRLICKVLRPIKAGKQLFRSYM